MNCPHSHPISFATLTCCLTLGFSISTPAYDQVFIFGDSLSDIGNLPAITGQPFPGYPFYFPNRFANNLIWSDYLSSQLGLNPSIGFSLNASTGVIPSDGLNFAVGGATTKGNIAGLPSFTGLQSELGLFSALKSNGNNTNTVDSNALYMVWIGANDYLGYYFTPQALPTLPIASDVVDNIGTSLVNLAQGGAQTILVGNLPNLGDIPFATLQGVSTVNGLNNFTSQHNTLLAQKVADLSQLYPTTQFILWDIHALFEDFFNNPIRYGLINTSSGCSLTDLGIGVVVPSIFPNTPVTCVGLGTPEQHLFWDSQHPSTQAHRFIARSAAQALGIPEPSNLSGIAVLGLGLLSGEVRRKIKGKA